MDNSTRDRAGVLFQAMGVMAITGTMMLPGTAAQAQSAPSVANADEANAAGEIIVTARKREERAIDVPSSLNVFSGDSIEAQGVNTLTDLQFRTPGLKIANAGTGTRISLRGVGTNISSFGGSPSVAIHLDGIYVSRPRFAVSELFDVGRVEVLKGPEGTLYGRNATGGAINILSQEPGDRLAADGFVGYGSRNLVTVRAGVDLPLSERGGLRISGAFANDDGYTQNLNAVGGEIDARQYAGVRLRGVYDFTETLTGALTVQYSRDKGTVGLGGSNNPDSEVFASLAPQRTSPRAINLDVPPRSDQEGLLLSGSLSLDLGEVTLRSLSGYLDYKTAEQADVDSAGALIAFTDSNSRSKFFSQEFQISGGSPESISYTGGLFYSRERGASFTAETDADFPDPTPFLLFEQQLRTITESYAAFAEVSVALSDRATILVGARYTDETVEGFQLGTFLGQSFPGEATVKNDAFTPKLLLEFKPYNDGKIYASVTRGFKSGGINFALRPTTFRPEMIWAYEIGSKNLIGDGRVEIGLAAFYYDYTDLQLRSAIFPPGQGAVITVNNVGKAEIYGAELTAVARATDALTLDFNGAYLHSKLNNFVSPSTRVDLSGISLPLSPKWSFTAGAEYRAVLGTAGILTARAEYNYQSSVYFPQFSDIDRERQDGFGLVNANIRYDLPGDRFYVALIGRNLANKTYLNQRFFFPLFADSEFYAAPRTVEARVGFKF